MKNKIYTLLIITAVLALAACQPQNVPQPDPQPQQDTTPFDASLLAGSYWNYIVEENRSSFGPTYFHFNADGTFEFYRAINYSYKDAYGTFNTIEEYEYTSGTYVVENNVLTCTFTKTRNFIKEHDAYRLYLAYNEENRWWPPLRLHVDSVSATHVYTNSGEKSHCTFGKLSGKPDGWDPFLIEPEKKVTEEALIAQWDLLNYFMESDTNYYYWYYYEPEYNGVQLLADGEVANNYFLGNVLYPRLVASGDINEDDYVKVDDSDCSWSLQGDAITMTCTSYILYDYVYDYKEGKYVDVYKDRITPDTPETVNLTVFSFTEHYLVLYSAEDDKYFVFVPGTPSAESAPSRIRPLSMGHAPLMGHGQQSPMGWQR